jgi:hypothetical protein
MEDIRKYTPRSGRVLREDGTWANEADGIGADGIRLVKVTASNLKSIGHSFAGTASAETVIAKPADGNLALVYVIAEVPSGLTSPTVQLNDGATRIGKWSVPSGDAITIISGSLPLEIDGDLTAQVSDTGITVSAWAVKV